MPRCLLALFSLASLPAAATTPTLEQPPTLTCLTPAPGHRGTPEYPEQAWRRGNAGRVMVELSFTTPHLRPAMKVLDSEGGRDFVDAVDTHVRTLRLPCLQASDVPALLRLDYVFKPTDRQTPAEVLPDPQQAERERLMACLQQPRDGPPGYPRAAQRDGVQGRLVVRLLFTSADGPPEVSVVSRPGSAVFVRPATRWAESYRLPCFQGMELRVELQMNYRFEGESHGFRDIGLRRFLGGIRGIQHQRVSFDFDTMACPFELRLNYRQPLLPNLVTQVSDPHPTRAPFLEWLAGAVLDLPDQSLDAAFADTVLLGIPCGGIDLHPQSALPSSTPKEKS